ncbi:MAG: DUF3768 domain-containing protein [Alphaproteobacteria bacterium]|nr:DUF3768 domain-containing protein [Alphaproteobacteria bacterium]MBP3516242.1 DUF3768 domain-containing protein [Alphaproteobacteria bacterium]
MAFVAAQFGSFDYKGEKIYFKIDYYDENYQYLSENPANPKVTNRVMPLCWLMNANYKSHILTRG